MTMKDRRRALMAAGKKGGSRLPAEYQEVEYISSNGSQRLSINRGAPGISLNIPATIKIKTKPNITSSAEQCIVGQNGTCTCDWQNGNYTGWKSQVISQVIGSIDTVIWTTKFHSSSGYVFTYNIFSYKHDSLSYPYNGKISEIEIEFGAPINMTDVLISCYRKSDGVIGMFSTYDNSFHTNLGSGTFTKGADV